MEREFFVTTSRGLDRNSLPMRLFEKAKRLGVWNPSEIDLRQDIQDWQGLQPDEKTMILHLVSLFQAGEEAVTLDLLPLIMTIAREGRLEEEMFLTSFLWEEAKHTDFFRRYLDEVTAAEIKQLPQGLSSFHSDNYRSIFYQALPQALQALEQDPSLINQARASVTYNLIVEGVLAETGYHAFFKMLARNRIMPGMQRAIILLKQDESRHIAYGIYLLARLIAADDSVWEVIEDTMNTLLVPAIGVIGDAFASYDPAPFGLQESDFIDYAIEQFTLRFERLEKARGASLDEIHRSLVQTIE